MMGALQWAAVVALSWSYWELNDPFYCIRHSRNCQCFSGFQWARQPPKLSPFVGDFDSGSLDLRESVPPRRHLDRFSRLFAQLTRVPDTQTHTQITLRATSVAICRILSTASRRCGKNESTEKNENSTLKTLYIENTALMKCT